MITFLVVKGLNWYALTETPSKQHDCRIQSVRTPHKYTKAAVSSSRLYELHLGSQDRVKAGILQSTCSSNIWHVSSSLLRSTFYRKSLFHIKLEFTFQVIPEVWFDSLVYIRAFIWSCLHQCHDLKAFFAKKKKPKKPKNPWSSSLLFKELDQPEIADCWCMGVANADLWLTCTQLICKRWISLI